MQSLTFKALLVTLAGTLGLIVGLISGIVSRIGGASVSTAILRGGASCGATITLMILIYHALGLTA